MCACILIAVQTVKRYLVLEDKTNSASSITEAVHYLNNVRFLSKCQDDNDENSCIYIIQIRLSMEPNDIAMREKLYAMLAPLTNSDAQEVNYYIDTGLNMAVYAYAY